MQIPILNLLLPPSLRWPQMLMRNPELEEDWKIILADFESQADAIIRSTTKTMRGKAAAVAHRLLNPSSEEYHEELRGVTKYLGADKDVALAGQLVYDASTVHGIDAVCGCTSSAQLSEGRPWHGRLMDWSWPSSIRGRVRLIKVVTRGGSYIAEHIPGSTGFVGAYTNRMAANLNQAPVSRLRWNRMPALWWFRSAIENGQFSRAGHAPTGGMTDALIHVTRRSSVTDRFYYRDGDALVRSSKLSSTPVVLTNTFDMHNVAEDQDGYEWSVWRENAVMNSRKRLPERRLGEAECEDTVHSWSVRL